MRRGYRAGYSAALRKCHADLDALAATFDAEIAALRNDFAKVKADVHRYRSIERGLDAERDIDVRLHEARQSSKRRALRPLKLKRS
jgi:hypothetical protein